MDLENLSESDARDIQLNQQNEYHGRYASNDKQVVESVSNALLKAIPGQRNFSNVSEAEQAAEPPVDPRAASQLQQQTAVELSPQIKATLEVVETNLRNEFGFEYGRNLEAAKTAALDLFGSVEAIEAFAEQPGTDKDPAPQAEAVRLLAKIGKSKGLKS